MAIRYYCDRCNNETTSMGALAKVTIDDRDGIVVNKDLCTSCVNDIRRLFDGLPVPTLTKVK